MFDEVANMIACANNLLLRHGLNLIKCDLKQSIDLTCHMRHAITTKQQEVTDEKEEQLCISLIRLMSKSLVYN